MELAKTGPDELGPNKTGPTAMDLNKARETSPSQMEPDEPGSYCFSRNDDPSLQNEMFQMNDDETSWNPQESGTSHAHRSNTVEEIP